MQRSAFHLRCAVLSLLALLAFLAASGAHPGAAFAQDEPIDKIRDLNKQALRDYEAGDFDSAKLGLLEAIGIGAKAGLGEERAMARTYANLAAVYVNGFHDQEKGVRYFGIALRITPDIQPTRALETPALKEAFAAASAGGKKGAPPAAAAAPSPPPPPESPPPESPPPPPPPPRKPARASSDEPDLPADIPEPLYCPNPDEAPPETAIVLRCVTQPDVHASRVLLFYRVLGGEKFSAVPAHRSRKGWYHGVIPASAAVGKSLHYYFEARDASDKPAGTAGKSDSPNLLILRVGAAPIGKGALAMIRKDRRSGEATEEDPFAGIKAENEAKAAQSIFHRPVGAVWVGLGLGMGRGWHPTADLEFRMPTVSVGAGSNAAWLGHLAPEVGYQINEQIALSLQGRFQYIPIEGSGDEQKGDPAKGAVAIMLRAVRLQGAGNTQLLTSAVIGGGDGFRLVIPPKPLMKLPRNDTVRGGPIVLGPGIGVVHHFNARLSLVTELRVLLGFPSFAAVGDLSVGMQLGF